MSIHIGQAGLQIGSACWELFTLEHGIKEDGMLDENVKVDENMLTFFSDTKSGKVVPRAMFVDLESSVISEIKNGSRKLLYNPNFLISGKEDAAK